MSRSGRAIGMRTAFGRVERYLVFVIHRARDGRCGPRSRGTRDGFVCSGSARAQTAENTRARGWLFSHSRRLRGKLGQSACPMRGLGLEFPQQTRV